VEYKDANSRIARTYVAEGTSADDVQKLPRYEMQCVDCHNRPTHIFELPERAVNRAMAQGRIPVSLPFIRKKGVEVLRADYASAEDAASRIPAAIQDYYRKEPARSGNVAQAAKGLLAIYNENVFPDLKVTWGTYANNLGHTDSAGCFRCHDEAHLSADQKTITQDCGACHEVVAASEASPEVLKTLGLEGRISGLQKK